jgi:hypothetical protein
VLSAIGNSLKIRIHKVIEQQTRELIDRLLLERISLARIARAIPISQQWLQPYVNEKYAGVPEAWIEAVGEASYLPVSFFSRFKSN